MAKRPKEFKREKRDGKYIWVWKLPNGAEVHQYSVEGDYSVYDSEGRYLGFTATMRHAEFLGSSGRMNVLPDTVSELDLWDLWNMATCHNRPVVCQRTKEQILMLPGDIAMVAKKEDDGYEVRLLDQQEFEEQYFDQENDCWDLTHLDGLPLGLA